MYSIEPERLDWKDGCQLNEKHYRMYEMCNKYEAVNTQKHFDWIAPNYEGMYLKMGYPDPEYIAKYVDKYAKINK